jgi:hypothetical protein
MYAGFSIQGYETDTGSHQQFLVTQGPQLHPVPGDLTWRRRGRTCSTWGTIVRALFTTLQVQPGRTLFVEGAATGTGLEALKSSGARGAARSGLVSSGASGCARGSGAGARDRPQGASAGRTCSRASPARRPGSPSGRRPGPRCSRPCATAHGGRTADYAVSHAGETAFPRSFQLLEPRGTLTFYGASSGYYFTFAGKRRGDRRPMRCCARAAAGGRGGPAVLRRARMRAARSGGLEAIEACVRRGGAHRGGHRHRCAARVRAVAGLRRPRARRGVDRGDRAPRGRGLRLASTLPRVPRRQARDARVQGRGARLPGADHQAVRERRRTPPARRRQPARLPRPDHRARRARCPRRVDLAGEAVHRARGLLRGDGADAATRSTRRRSGCGSAASSCPRPPSPARTCATRTR